jgi:hypothetical protein
MTNIQAVDTWRSGDEAASSRTSDEDATLIDRVELATAK